MYEIAEAWKYIKPKCGCHGENKIDMVIQEGPASLFYACPKYHPENREPGERACNNRLNLIEYQKMVEDVIAGNLVIDDDYANLKMEYPNMKITLVE